jgi:phosphoribosylpyrophosphate synthetase
MKGVTRFILFSPAQERFARQFADDDDVFLRVERGVFPDQTPNIKLHLAPLLDHVGKTSVVYFSHYSDMAEKYAEQLIIWVLADTLNVTSLTVVDMYDPLATMERVCPHDEGRIATANVDAQWWKTLPRKVHRVLFDHHTLQNRFYFTGGNVQVRFLTATALVTDWAGSVAFPDDGAAKRFGAEFSQPQLVCGKKRDGHKRIVEIKEGDVAGRDVLVVDDLVRTGGTLIECIKALKAAGAAKVSVFVTHAAFTSQQQFSECPLLDTFFTTDTIPHELADAPKFKVKSVVALVKKAIQQIENQL